MEPGSFNELAENYYLIGKHNMKAAIDSFNSANYPECVYWLQQAIEKLVKALISIKGGFISGHSVTGWLAMNYSSHFTPTDFKVISELEVYSTQSRYPTKKKDKIIDPIKLFTKEKTELIIKDAEKLFNKLTKLYEEFKFS